MIRVMQGNCIDALKELPDASVQCVVTSPPYYGLRDYGVAEQIGAETTPSDYIAALVSVFREVRRVLRDDGTLWLNLGDSYAANGVPGLNVSKPSALFHGGKNDAHVRRAKDVPPGLKAKDLLMIPARVALALQADGWWLRSDIIWAKSNPMPESATDRPTSAHEHVFLLTKSPRYFYDAEAVREKAINEGRVVSYDGTQKNTGHENRTYPGAKPRDILISGRNIRNVWTIATAPYAEAHFATFPPALAERCIKAGTSERGCCAACGAPWVRQVNRRFVPQPDISLERGVRGVLGQKPMDASNGWGGFPRGSMAAETTCWSQSCTCPPSDPVPCTVLDPFAGAFTTAMVADRLQRHAIGIELSPAYCDMARARITKDAGMFAEMV